MASPPPLAPGPRLGAAPEDFRVEEVPLYAPRGEGDHTFVWVEKRGVPTEAVARALARAAGVRPREVGYAGRKDRVAVARQWLSLPALAPERASALEGPGWRVLEAARHPHKLRTGQLAGNRFELRLRGVGPRERARLPEAVARLVREGFPNRFGAQRFGRDGRNAERGRARLSGEAPLRDRRRARFELSALQAAVFNAVLDARPLPLGRLEPGDVAFLHASGGAFVVEDAAREQPRAEAFELSPSGPLFGTRLLEARGAPGERERAALARFGLPAPAALRPPRGLRLRGARRPLRVRPEGLSWAPLAEEGDEAAPAAVRLAFALPPGSYATALLEALFGAPLPRASADPAGPEAPPGAGGPADPARPGPP